MKKEFLYICGVLLLSVFVISCSGGGGSYGGSSSALETVLVTASYPSSGTSLEADARAENGFVSKTSTTVQISVSKLANLPNTITASSVTFYAYSLTFTPVTAGAPAINPIPNPRPTTGVIAGNGSGQFPIDVLFGSEKDVINASISPTDKWLYNVNVELYVEEIDTGYDTTVEVDFVMQYSDFEAGTASIAGFVFIDNNANDFYDAGDTLVPGVTVVLSGGASTTTAANGSYIFEYLGAMDYSVTFDTTGTAAAGLLDVALGATPPSGTDSQTIVGIIPTVTVADGAIETGWNMGVR